MFDFSELYDRTSIISEARVSEYSKYHPEFGKISSTFRESGYPSAPLFTIMFIAEVVAHFVTFGNLSKEDYDTEWDEDTLELKETEAYQAADEEYKNLISYIMKPINPETGKGYHDFKSKRIALLNVLNKYKDEILEKSERIDAYIKGYLPYFIKEKMEKELGRDGQPLHGVSRAEKYEANAAAIQMAKQAKDLQKELKNLGADEIADIFSNGLAGAVETMIVTGSVNNLLERIHSTDDEDYDPGTKEFVLDQVASYVGEKVNSLKDLKKLIIMLEKEKGYEEIAFHLSGLYKTLKVKIPENIQGMIDTPPQSTRGSDGSSTQQKSRSTYNLSDVVIDDSPALSEFEDVEVEDVPDIKDQSDVEFSDLEHPLDAQDYYAEPEDVDIELDDSDEFDDVEIEEEPKELPPVKLPPQKERTRRNQITFDDITFGEDEEIDIREPFLDPYGDDPGDLEDTFDPQDSYEGNTTIKATNKQTGEVKYYQNTPEHLNMLQMFPGMFTLEFVDEEEDCEDCYFSESSAKYLPTTRQMWKPKNIHQLIQRQNQGIY